MQQERPKADLRQKIALLKRAICGLPRKGEVGTKVKVPEPKPFNGARSAKDLENLLQDIEQYFKAARVPDKEKVTITSIYLLGDAKLWWRTHVEDNADAGRGKIDSWGTLKKELKDQFLPINTTQVEEIETHQYGARICQDIRFFDARYQEHVEGRHAIQFHVEFATLGTVGVKKAGYA